MNTPTHALVSLFALGRGCSRREAVALIAGGVLPDLPIFVLFVWARFIQGVPSNVIWSQTYYQPGWQAVVDAAHSIPLALLLAGLCWMRRTEAWARPGLLFASSLLLHSALDLPVHHDDGHRHFWPLSAWRFDSPISYWDPCCYGHTVSLLEVLAMMAIIVALWRRGVGASGRTALGVTGLVYLGGLAAILGQTLDFPWLGALLGGGR